VHWANDSDHATEDIKRFIGHSKRSELEHG